MPSLEELFPSTPGKFKIERSHNSMNRQFHCCFASTSTMFLWALFLIALTASYLSFQSFVDSGSRYFSASWGGIQWEKQVLASAQIHRNNGMSVLVTGAAGFVGTHVSMALCKRGDGVVGIDNFNSYSTSPSRRPVPRAYLTRTHPYPSRTSPVFAFLGLPETSFCRFSRVPVLDTYQVAVEEIRDSAYPKGLEVNDLQICLMESVRHTLADHSE
ncbi:UDP-glucuronate 4-epimerase 1 [Turnera subulata]|uniref:UDP-glucuronate 4-epimerase 1 n=1 Tax=Turnera subulata TaxID=218843 RepID=A0A9Q0G1Z1_9ROSI|nr:UDP-glucuronate 4-epimerase 1 [Turnera subulata]